jgi:pilus assembly protein Flp/PilA
LLPELFSRAVDIEAPVIRIAYALLTRIPFKPTPRASTRVCWIARRTLQEIGIMSKINNFLHDERGATMVEYSILIGIITAAAIASIALIGIKVSTAWSTLVTAWS